MKEADFIQYFDLIAHKYAQDKFKQPFSKERVQAFLQHLPQGAKILDFGCGPGRDCQYFKEHGYQPIGLDFSKKMIDEAEQRVKDVKFVRNNLFDIKIEPHSFDGFWARSVFQHIPLGNYYKYFTRINYILKPGGIFYINVNEGADHTVVKSDRVFDTDIKTISSQIRLDNLSAMIKEKNFEIIDTGEYQKNDTKWVYVVTKKTEDIEVPEGEK